jgi:hypothetical protein
MHDIEGETQMKRPIGLLCAIGLLTFASTAWAQSPAPVMFPGTGHFYQLVFAGTMNFDAAKAYANSLNQLGVQGHLVSITSAEEQAFVASLGVPSTAWIGGFQADTSSEPADGWTWIDGEPWSYTNWGTGEPNDADGENCLHWRADNGWNDINCANAYDGLVVEYDFENVPVPTLSGWLLAILTVLLLAGGYALLRHRRTANATS